MNLWQYTNGIGHLVMSILFTFVGLFLIVLCVIVSSPYTGLLLGLGISTLGTVSAAWFIPGAAKQVATNVVQQVQETTKQ